MKKRKLKRIIELEARLIQGVWNQYDELSDQYDAQTLELRRVEKQRDEAMERWDGAFAQSINNAHVALLSRDPGYDMDRLKAKYGQTDYERLPYWRGETNG